jgi:hypothetical protein
MTKNKIKNGIRKIARTTVAMTLSIIDIALLV